MGPSEQMLLTIGAMKSDLLLWGSLLIGIELVKIGIKKAVFIVMGEPPPDPDRYRYGIHSWRWEMDYRNWEVRNNRT